jgi:hypothetical protein
MQREQSLKQREQASSVHPNFEKEVDVRNMMIVALSRRIMDMRYQATGADGGFPDDVFDKDESLQAKYGFGLPSSILAGLMSGRTKECYPIRLYDDDFGTIAAGTVTTKTMTIKQLKEFLRFKAGKWFHLVGKFPPTYGVRICSKKDNQIVTYIEQDDEVVDVADIQWVHVYLISPYKST